MPQKVESITMRGSEIRRALPLAIALIVPAAHASTARAQDGEIAPEEVAPGESVAEGDTQASRDAEAREAFLRGQSHFENGRFAEAAEQFELAYRLSGRVRLLYNAYLAYRDLQDQENGARTLRLFLEQTPEGDLAEGEHERLTARLQAMEEAIAAREREVAETEAARREAQRLADQQGSQGFDPSPVGFIVGGAGLAVGVGALVTGILSTSDLDTLRSECVDRVCPDRTDLRDTADRGETLALVTDVLWITGAAAVAAGVVLLFVLQEEADGDRPDVGLACTSDGCLGTVGGRF